jgi:hypothetical protein
VIARTMPTLAELTNVLDGIRIMLRTCESLAPELVRGHPSWQEVKNRTLLLRRSLVRLATVQQRWLITRALAKEKSHAVRPLVALVRAADRPGARRGGTDRAPYFTRLLEAESRELIDAPLKRGEIARPSRPSTQHEPSPPTARAGAGASGD